MREILDILGRKIEVGDIVLRPVFSQLTRVYILGITEKSVQISRCIANIESINLSYTKTNADLSEHNAKQSLSFPPDFYILEKNAVIPENLKQFIKY